MREREKKKKCVKKEGHRREEFIFYCFFQAWSKPNKEDLAPHIVLMIKRFNLVSAWVATEIVKSEKIGDRVLKVKKFLNIAKHCRDISNFNGVMEILAGLQNAAIHRMKKTWDVCT